MDDSITAQRSFKITADDFGYCKMRNEGIKELITKGIVNSISVIINGSHVEKMQNQSLRIGLHFNLTEGTPVSSIPDVLSLVDEGRMFLGKFGFREKLKCGQIKESEIELELVNQIDRFISVFGHVPDYVDGHQHVHVLFPVVTHCATIMTKYGITKTRIPREIGISSCDWIDAPRHLFYQAVCEDAATAAVRYSRYGIEFPNYFIGLSTMSADMSTERFKRALNLILHDTKESNVSVGSKGALVEIMVHPGYPSLNDEGGCGAGPDAFSCSEDRLHELKLLKSDAFVQLIHKFDKAFVKNIHHAL